MIEESSSSSSSSTTGNSTRKQVVKARWGILRNALLQSSQQQQQQHSIHRFSGYNLLEGKPANSESSTSESKSSIGRIEPLLTEFRWGSENNIDQLEVSILALAACFPKGNCMRIISQLDPQNDGSHPGASSSFSDTWLESVKKRCQPSVRVWKVSEESEEHEEANEKTSVATMITTLLVQESSTSTKCQALLYDFDEPKHANNLKGMRNENKENDGDSPIVKYNNHIIWTREPRETRLSLDDLVSHRKNNGVDNTGNICVWDSERTLAYLLYHHFDDFFNQNMIQPQILENENRSGIRILELGTGMAGLSAVALGLRLAMRQEEHGDRIKEGNASKDENEKEEKKSIHITLTDGNPSGVKNNVVNQYLTKLNSQTMWQGEGYCSHYLDLNVDCETLLWTTDLESEKERPVNQDVVLVSDCVHFQNFHAALATTALRCLRTGASAIFCQPTRGPSLDNFLNLLLAATLDKDPIGSTSLLSYTWLSHPIIEKEDHEARLHYSHVYDKNLHHPKILVITKLREISEEDRNRFVAYQHRYSPIVPKTVEGT